MREDLLSKNNCILELEKEKAKSSRDESKIRQLALRAAELEGRIAMDLLSRGRPQDAVINLISQASCLVDANEPGKAREVFAEALALAKDARVQQFINGEILALPSNQVEPGHAVKLVEAEFHSTALGAVVLNFRRERVTTESLIYPTRLLPEFKRIPVAASKTPQRPDIRLRAEGQGQEKVQVDIRRQHNGSELSGFGSLKLSILGWKLETPPIVVLVQTEGRQGPITPYLKHDGQALVSDEIQVANGQWLLIFLDTGVSKKPGS